MKNLTVEHVNALQIGESVYICKAGHEPVRCTVACRAGKKFLTYRDKGQIKRFNIRDYPGMEYHRRLNNG